MYFTVFFLEISEKCTTVYSSGLINTGHYDYDYDYDFHQNDTQHNGLIWDPQHSNTQHNTTEFCYNECCIFSLLCWMSLYWMSLCWMSLCLMSLCWMSLWWMSLYWVSGAKHSPWITIFSNNYNTNYNKKFYKIGHCNIIMFLLN